MPKIILEFIEHVFYNVLMPLMIISGGCRMEEYEEMITEEYKKIIIDLVNNMDIKRLIYYYTYIIEYEKE